MPRLFVSPPDEIESLPQTMRRVSRRRWSHAVLAQARDDMPHWWPVGAAKLPIERRAWQFVAAMMMLSGLHRRVLLADAVGMGKTVQAGLLLHEIHAREPDAATLVVSPAGLIAQWSVELRQRVSVEACVLDAMALRAEAAQPQRLVDAARVGSCWLISLDLLRQPDVIALIARTRWTLLIVDEAHHCVAGTARLEAVSRVAAASTRVLLMTASPTAAGLSAADRLRNVGARAGEPPMPIVRRDATHLLRPDRRVRILHVELGDRHLGLCARLDRFVERARRESGAAGLLPSLVLRRRASSCPAALARSLARRIEVLRQTALEPSTPTLFDSTSQDGQDDQLMQVPAWRDHEEEREELEDLLREASGMPPAGRKLSAVARLIRRSAQPVVVFTTYVDTLRALRALIDASGVVIVHGEQPEVLRSEAILAFTSGDARVLLTTDAAAEGLNLHQRCRLVVHAEVPASPRQFEQRTGRLDRYGQRHHVHAVVMASRSFEDRQALARLSSRAADDDSWLASTVPQRCRRTELATRMFAGWRRMASGPADAVDEDEVPVCELRPRRWHRMAQRLELPAGTSALCVGRLRVTGGAELTALRRPVCALGLAERSSAPLVPQYWPVALRGFVTRARRLTRRLASWEHDAARAAASEAMSTGPDLFMQPESLPSPCQVSSTTAEPSLTMELAGVVARRSNLTRRAR